ncbi:phage tail protein [Paenibacillaceae bacterium WGS1546]|uniref:phage tail protein n=1 Tax=Cohnella sp. WGS1546 TaxID=3366810 RepID=UPI00372D6706
MVEAYIGEIRLFAGNYPPFKWVPCDGRLLEIEKYMGLFSVIRFTYGGDGGTKFAVPDLTGRLPVHAGIAKSGTIYALGQKGGTETVTLTAEHLAPHTHPVRASSQPGTSESPAQAYWAGSTINQYGSNVPDAPMSPHAIAATGGRSAHDNMMPYLPVTFIMATEGYFP